MLSVIFCALIGVAAGYLLRHLRALQRVHSTITLTICFMLFVLGLSVGENATIIRNLWLYGSQALLISVASIVGSAIAACLLHRYWFKDLGKEDEK